MNVLVDVNSSRLFVADLFGTLDPFGSSSFSSNSNSSAGFADFSHMSKPRDPFEGRASWLPDYQKVPETRSHPENTLFFGGGADCIAYMVPLKKSYNVHFKMLYWHKY